MITARLPAVLDGGYGYDVNQGLRTDQVVSGTSMRRLGVWSRRLCLLTACSSRYRQGSAKRLWSRCRASKEGGVAQGSRVIGYLSLVADCFWPCLTSRGELMYAGRCGPLNGPAC